MSAVSMADLVIVRRRPSPVPAPVGLAPAGLGTAGPQPGGQAPADNKVTAAMKVITTYIPTEVLTLYVAAIAIALPEATVPRDYGPAWIAFWAFLVASPVVTWIVFAAKAKAADPAAGLPWLPSRWPALEMLFSAIAFAAWAAALPATPFAEFSWYSAGVAGFLVLVVTTGVGLIATLV